MKPKIIVSDFDGVIGDSIDIALLINQKIVSLFDSEERVETFSDYYRLLGKKSELKNITEIESNSLRELYRIMYRHNLNEIKLFDEVLKIYSDLDQKPIIVSSSYSDVIKTVLGDSQKYFDGVYGYELGRKREILQRFKLNFEFIYVIDTFRDITICKDLNIPVIATTWGYDPIDKLKDNNPDYIVTNYSELTELFEKLNFKTLKK
jgi:phosphoglycolate phosphatase-like HAD superfamily hydrolase